MAVFEAALRWHSAVGLLRRRKLSKEEWRSLVDLSPGDDVCAHGLNLSSEQHNLITDMVGEANVGVVCFALRFYGTKLTSASWRQCFGRGVWTQGSCELAQALTSTDLWPEAIDAQSNSIMAAAVQDDWGESSFKTFDIGQWWRRWCIAAWELPRHRVLRPVPEAERMPRANIHSHAERVNLMLSREALRWFEEDFSRAQLPYALLLVRSRTAAIETREDYDSVFGVAWSKTEWESIMEGAWIDQGLDVLAVTRNDCASTTVGRITASPRNVVDRDAKVWKALADARKRRVRWPLGVPPDQELLAELVQKAESVEAEVDPLVLETLATVSRGEALMSLTYLVVTVGKRVDVEAFESLFPRRWNAPETLWCYFDSSHVHADFGEDPTLNRYKALANQVGPSFRITLDRARKIFGSDLALVQEKLRTSGLVCRIMGDEFVVVDVGSIARI